MKNTTVARTTAVVIAILILECCRAHAIPQTRAAAAAASAHAIPQRRTAAAASAQAIPQRRAGAASGAAARVRLGYWPSYDAHRYPAAAIDSTLYTHLNFAFAQLNGSTLVPGDGAAAAHISTFSRTVKSRNRSLKTLISIGGGGAPPGPYAAMVSGAATRADFIQSSISLARANGFDGLDLDWEFPQNDDDMSHLAALLTEWRAAVVAEAAQVNKTALLLSAAVYYAATVKNVGGGTYPIKAINANLDWVSLMAFDYHGSWEPNNTGAHTALYCSDGGVCTDTGVSSWLAAGLQPSKAVLGLAAYGKTWLLPAGAPPGVGVGGAAAGAGATMTYAEIVRWLVNATTVPRVDNASVMAYAQVGSLWVGFDNPKTVALKVSYLKAKNMRGYFFWTASFDLFWMLSRTAAAVLKTG